MTTPQSLPKDLVTFMETYETLANKRNFDFMISLISENAIYWFSDGSYTGLREIRSAFEQTWTNLPNEIYSISNINLLLSEELSAVICYNFTSTSVSNGIESTFKGRGTNILQKFDGSWKIIHEHLSLMPKK